MRRIRISGLIVLIGVARVWGAGPTKSYHVGNSLTWDANPPTIAQIAAVGGQTLSAGYHIMCGQNLTYMAAHPAETCVTPTAYGTFGPALSGNVWDFVTLEPYSGSTAANERAAAVSMIDTLVSNPANRKTQVYVYAAWPQQREAEDHTLSTDFHTDWTKPLDGKSQLSRPFMDWMVNELRQATAGSLDHEILMVPVGDVVDRIDALSKAGEIPGVIGGAHALYRDLYHFNNVGRFVAATTFYATMYRANPVGMGVTAASQQMYGDPGDQMITPALATALQQAVWDVLQSHPYAGVVTPGDANRDGRVDADDFARVDRGYAMGMSGWENGDFDRDGSVTTADYLMADGSYIRGGGAAPALLGQRAAAFGDAYVETLTASVPEPLAPAGTGVLTAVVATRRGRGRRRR